MRRTFFLIASPLILGVVVIGYAFFGSALSGNTGANIPDLAAKWTFKASPGQSDVKSVTVADGTVYIVGDHEGTVGNNPIDEHFLQAVDASSGMLRWKYLLPAVSETAPAVSNGVLYYGTSERGTRKGCLNAADVTTGSLLWQADLAETGKDLLDPIVGNGIVYVGTENSLDTEPATQAIYAIDATSGKILWHILVLSNVTSYTVANGVLYFESATAYEKLHGLLRAVDAKTGKDLWKFDMGSTVNPALPVVSNGIVYATGSFPYQDGVLYALSGASGAQLWHFEAGKKVLSVPIVTAGKLYIGVNQPREDCIDNCPPPPKYFDYLYTLDPKTGSELSQVQTDAAVANIQLANNTIISTGYFPYDLYALDPTNGKALGKFLAGNYYFTPSAVYGNVVYVGQHYTGNLYAIPVPTPQPTPNPPAKH